MKLARSEKAVSPVIATLLLILIAVAAAVLVYMWVTGYVGTATATSPEMEEKLKIEAIGGVSAGSPTTITCYVRNVGGADAVVVNWYLERGGTVTSQGTVSGSSVTVRAGSMTTVKTTRVTLSSGITYVIKLVTKSGVEVSYAFKAS